MIVAWRLQSHESECLSESSRGLTLTRMPRLAWESESCAGPGDSELRGRRARASLRASATRSERLMSDHRDNMICHGLRWQSPSLSSGSVTSEARRRTRPGIRRAAAAGVTAAGGMTVPAQSGSVTGRGSRPAGGSGGGLGGPGQLSQLSLSHVRVKSRCQAWAREPGPAVSDSDGGLGLPRQASPAPSATETRRLPGPPRPAIAGFAGSDSSPQ